MAEAGDAPADAGEGAGEKRRPAEASAEEELRAAKRRALEEAKKAALARILESAGPAEASGDAAASSSAPADATATGKEEGEEGDDEEDDEEEDSDEEDDPSRPVANLSIVDFLRSEQQAAVASGKVLDSSGLVRTGMVIKKEAVMEKRVPKELKGTPKPEDMVGGGALVAAPEGSAAAARLPSGARAAPKAVGNFAAYGRDEGGGVMFDANRQRQERAKKELASGKEWRPPAPTGKAPGPRPLLAPTGKNPLLGAPSGSFGGGPDRSGLGYVNAPPMPPAPPVPPVPSAPPAVVPSMVGAGGSDDGDSWLERAMAAEATSNAAPNGGVFTNASLRAHIAGGPKGQSKAAMPAVRPPWQAPMKGGW